MAPTGGTPRRRIAATALATLACAFGPASVAEAATPLDQVTAQALSTVGQVTTQVDSTVNRTVSGVSTTLERTGAAAGRVVDAASGSTGPGAHPGAPGPTATVSIRETARHPVRRDDLRRTSGRPEPAATSARAGLGIEAKRGSSAPAPAAPPRPAGAERQESAGAPSLPAGLPGAGLGLDDAGLVTGGIALLLTAFALMLMMGGSVPPALRSRVSVAAGVRRLPPLIVVLDRPG